MLRWDAICFMVIFITPVVFSDMITRLQMDAKANNNILIREFLKKGPTATSFKMKCIL